MMRGVLGCCAVLACARAKMSHGSRALASSPCDSHAFSELVWVHTPKTGSTFALTLSSACCNERFGNLSARRSEIVLQHARTVTASDGSRSYVSRA